jgi:nucleotide-binding universal stress UspA family protein
MPVQESPVRPRIIAGIDGSESSAGASLLVVGSRGHGGFAEALLGSVSQHCGQHALCPVVVVRGPEPARPASHGGRPPKN